MKSCLISTFNPFKDEYFSDKQKFAIHCFTATLRVIRVAETDKTLFLQLHDFCLSDS